MQGSYRVESHFFCRRWLKVRDTRSRFFMRAIISGAGTLGARFSIGDSLSVELREDSKGLHGGLRGGSLRIGCGISERIGGLALVSRLKLGDMSMGILLDMPQGTQKTE